MPTTVSLSVSGEHPVEVEVSDQEGAQVVNPGQTWNFTLEADHELHLTVTPAGGQPVETEAAAQAQLEAE